MQKALIAIVLALTLSSVVAVYSPVNGSYVKGPLVVCTDNDTNCTAPAILTLGSLSAGEVSILAYSAPVVPAAGTGNTSLWSIFTRKVDAKTLTASNNNTLGFNATQVATLAYGYAIQAFSEKDVNNTFQLYLYQTRINGGVVLPKVLLTNNSDAAYTPTLATGLFINSKTVFAFFYVNAEQKRIDVTAITLGAGVIGKTFTLTSTYGSNLQVAGSEALSTGDVLALWIEGTTLKQAVASSSRSNITNPTDVGLYDKTYTCRPYVTDQKFYGALCYISDATNIVFYANTNTTNLTKLFSGPVATTNFLATYPYAGYLAVLFADTSVAQSTTLSFEVWDLAAVKVTRNRTSFITYDPIATVIPFRLPAGGLYTLAYNTDANKVRTNITVGLFLGASYLTTVFGFILTIIAGLFLF